MKTRDIAMTAVMTALMCLAGMVLRWVSPALVPFSVLPLIVYLAGMILGAKNGALSMFLYVLIGLLGVPVFASAPFGGPGYIQKPTFGFLIGYIAAAYIVGLIYRQRGNLVRGALSVIAGLAMLYLFGLAYLYGILNWVIGHPTTIAGVFAIGFVPYIALDLLKAAIAVIVGNEVVKRRALSKG